MLRSFISSLQTLSLTMMTTTTTTCSHRHPRSKSFAYWTEKRMRWFDLCRSPIENNRRPSLTMLPCQFCNVQQSSAQFTQHQVGRDDGLTWFGYSIWSDARLLDAFSCTVTRKYWFFLVNWYRLRTVWVCSLTVLSLKAEIEIHSTSSVISYWPMRNISEGWSNYFFSVGKDQSVWESRMARWRN
jgi:hypothetical protein